MKYRYTVLMILMIVLINGCGSRDTEKIKENNGEKHNDTFTRLVKQQDEVGDSGETSEERTESTNTEPDVGYPMIVNPEDFRIDTKEITPDEQLKNILYSNEEYISSFDMDVETLVNSEDWEYRESEDLYSIVAGVYPNLHAVVVSLADGILEIDP